MNRGRRLLPTWMVGACPACTTWLWCWCGRGVGTGRIEGPHGWKHRLYPASLGALAAALASLPFCLGQLSLLSLPAEVGR